MSTDETGLGAAIRAWRDRLTPAAVGLPAGRARRAAGLRREELAELAGVSVDYIVRLEQGRATTPSDQVVSSLARALQLSRQERDHLYRLAGTLPVTGDRAADPGRLTQWPVVHQNREASDRAVVADLRRASARYPADARLTGLISRTMDGNVRFARLWHEGAVGGHSEDRKTIRHPAIGDITVDCDVLSDSDTDLKIVIYTALPGSEDETKLDLIRVARAAIPDGSLF